MFLKVDSLSKKYQNGENDFFAIKDISFEIGKGEICTILGPSGSGKSTLMNIIGGLEGPTSGSVKVEEREIANFKAKKLSIYRREMVGFVFQFYNLIPNLTIKENIEICAHLGENPLEIDTLIEKVGLGEQKDKFPAQLSGGQQQRVAIARALVKNPKLLLCDEPTGALDYNTSKEVLQLFKEINETYNTTILMITHNDAITEMSDRVIKIKDGRVRANKVNTQKVEVCDLEW